MHSALLNAGLMPDPYLGCNETNVQWVAKADWEFSRSFDVEAGLAGRRRIVLEIEDADTFADVYLNGVKIGTLSNRFARWTLDAKKAVKAGRNEIRAVFKSAWAEADRRAAVLGRRFPMPNVPWAKNQALIRKPACHAGWDWGPAQMTTGFCGPVRLVAHDGPKIDYVYSTQSFNDDFSSCELTTFADVTEADGRVHTVTNLVSIDNPPLWWPNGAGERKFYEYTVCVGDEAITRRIGLRKLEVDTSGGAMAFKVNGRRLFMKGANWIPCDAFESRQTPERYRDLLSSAAAANMNMVRLWGGGQYERDVFYDVCDELGLLVWHDHMFSCAVYPADDGFLAEVERELAHQLRRLRDHASIALWCGDNECVGALKWFAETKADPEYYKDALMKRHALQAAMVAKYDPTRMFWPSSPCAGPGSFADNWKNDSQGDMHNWQVWHQNRPFDAYYEYRPRFCSEFGYQSFPSMEVAETFATREQVLSRAPEFEWHQKNAGGNRRIRETMQSAEGRGVGTSSFAVPAGHGDQDGRRGLARAASALHGHSLLAAERQLACRVVELDRVRREVEAAPPHGAALLRPGRRRRAAGDRGREGRCLARRRLCAERHSRGDGRRAACGILDVWRESRLVGEEAGCACARQLHSHLSVLQAAGLRRTGFSRPYAHHAARRIPERLAFRLLQGHAACRREDRRGARARGPMRGADHPCRRQACVLRVGERSRRSRRVRRQLPHASSGAASHIDVFGCA